MSNFPEYLDFAEERLELGIDYGAVGGMSFRTEIIETSDGKETRNPKWHLPLGRWQLGDRFVADSEPDKLAEVTYLKEFHAARLGSKQGFRFKDWSDFQGIGQEVGTGDDVETEWQLKKWYRVGDAAICRPITKPVEGTVKIYFDGVEQTQVTVWTINHNSGLIRFVNPVPNGVSITSDFEFDIPVCFEADRIGFNLEAVQGNRKLYRLESVFVKEIRYPINFFITPEEITINETLDLGIVYDSIESIEFNTSKQDVASGYSRKDANWEEGKSYLNLGDRAVNKTELEELLNYFWVAQGKANTFNSKYLGDKYIAKFNSDSLNLKFIAKERERYLFDLSGLKLELKENPAFEIPPFSFPLEPVFIDLQDPNNSYITAAGDSFYGGGGSGGNNGDSSTNFGISSYSADGVSFDQLPPGETASNVTYNSGILFWAAGTLHLLVRGASSNSAYYNRLIYYRLNAASGWEFEYQDVPIWDYTVSITDVNAPRVRKTPTGTSLFLRASDLYPLGTGTTTTNNGLLRFEIKDNGSGELSFIPNPGALSSGWGAIDAVYGDKAYTAASINAFLGAFNGLDYYASRFDNGFPISYNAAENHSQGNIWQPSSLIDQKRVIYHEGEEFFSYFPVSTSNKPSFYTVEGQQGTYLIKVLTRNYCENDRYACSSEFRKDLVHFYLKKTWDSEPQLIDVQQWLISSTYGNSHYIQTYNAQKQSVDSSGNILVYAGSKMIYYRSGSGYGIDVTSQLGYTMSNTRALTGETPYGFGIFAQDFRSLFDPLVQMKLIFVQHANQ